MKTLLKVILGLIVTFMFIGLFVISLQAGMFYSIIKDMLPMLQGGI